MQIETISSNSINLLSLQSYSIFEFYFLFNGFLNWILKHFFCPEFANFGRVVYSVIDLLNANENVITIVN